MRNRRIYIITGNKYPKGDAGAIRQHYFAKLFESLGYEVTIFGYGEYTGASFKEFEGIQYTSLRSSYDNKIVRLFKRVFSASRYINCVEKLVPPQILLMVDAEPRLFKWAEKYANKRQIQLLHDSVEWYSAEEFKLGKFAHSYIQKNRLNTRILNQKWKVISISSFLEKHFKNRNIACVRIPVILDVENMHPDVQTDDEKVEFVYAGAPGWKDNLRDVLVAYSQLKKEELQRSRFHVIGVNQQQLIKNCKVPPESIRQLGESLVIHGRLPHDETVKYVRACDFTVLVRNHQLRYAKAGFPTKVAESMALATPVVCNLSSDLGMYLADGRNAVLIDGFSVEKITEALSRAICLDQGQKIQMKRAARLTAETYFDYRKYADTIKTLLLEAGDYEN